MAQQKSPLAEHLLETLYKPWKKNREPLETKWQDNWEAFRGIVAGKWKACEGDSWRSETNLNKTREKVMAAFSIVMEQVIRGGRIAFNCKADTGNPWIALMLGEGAEEQMEADALKMKELVDEDLAKCDAEKEYARNILSAGVYGETYAKEVTASYPRTLHRPVMPEGATIGPGMDPAQLMWEPYTEEKDGFSWLCVSPWEIVRDMESDDLQAITGFFHDRSVSPYFLRKRKGKDGWDDKAIERVIKAAAEKSTDKDDESLTPGLKRLENRSNTIRYREYHGRIPTVLADRYEARKPNEDIQSPSPEELKDGNEVEVICVVADDEVAMFARNDMRRPLERAVWEEALDDIGGQGVADSIRDIHMAITGAFRAFEDGAKASSALILALKSAKIVNAEDISKGIQAGALMLEIDDDGPGSVNDAIKQIVLQNPANNISELLQELKQLEDEASMIPRISTGMSPKNDSATAYEIGQRVERSVVYIGMVIRNLDEGLVEPMVQRVIDRFSRDPDFEGPRGDFLIEAQGFAGFEARTNKIAAIYKMLELAMSDPDIKRRLKLDPVLSKVASALDEIGTDFFRTDKEMQEDDDRVKALAMGLPQDPTLEAKANRDNAAAEKDRALIEQNAEKLRLEAEKVEIDKDKGETERAKAVVDMEQKVNKANEQPVPEAR